MTSCSLIPRPSPKFYCLQYTSDGTLDRVLEARIAGWYIVHWRHNNFLIHKDQNTNFITEASQTLLYLWGCFYTWMHCFKIMQHCSILLCLILQNWTTLSYSFHEMYENIHAWQSGESNMLLQENKLANNLPGYRERWYLTSNIWQVRKPINLDKLGSEVVVCKVPQ